MVQLSGNNLGKRQKKLNSLVNEAVTNKVKFEDVIIQKDHYDVDILFKIDLASKYKKVRYIIEILKSGDSLYISRALKCIWLYGDEYTEIINPDYLNIIVFPFMSMKMKRKMLTAIATHVKNEDRAANFYEYSLKVNLNHLALKFLINTSKVFKQDVIESNDLVLDLITDQEPAYLRHFIGSSFTLAETYLSSTIHSDKTKMDVLMALNHLYFISSSKYLDLIEKHENCFYVKYGSNQPLGLRISKNVVKNFKDRVLAKPKLYVKILNKKMLARQSTYSDAKIYLAGVLPDTHDMFWRTDFCKNYDYLLNLIPSEEKFEYVKSIYTGKYPDNEFETIHMFYKHKYYNLMTLEQKEAWALQHLESEKEILGVGNDYIWYKFVNFEKAFEEIKKCIMKTPNKDKRAEIVLILIESAKNNDELEKLLQYYYDRHVNENIYDKKNFLNRVIAHHNVFRFDAKCWDAFEKLLYSIDVYNVCHDSFGTDSYIVITLIYYIINKKELTDSLKEVLVREISFYAVKRYSTDLGEDIQELIYQFIYDYNLEKVKALDKKDKNTVTKHVKCMLNLLENFNKTEKDVPEIVLEYMKLDWDNYMDFSLFKKRKEKELKASDLMRYLKKDTDLLVKNMPTLKWKIINNHYDFNINEFLRKVRIYFPDDLGKTYVEFLQELLSDEKISNRVYYYAVHGFFQLADEGLRNDFMIKYAPQESKIKHSEIDRAVLYIQESICRFACFARPPVELSNMLLYLKGDYVQYCLPIFNTYVANLPMPLCLSFVESILDKPLSVQKHGLRLAFHCFDTENLKNVVLESWGKTKNVSLRELLYKSVFDKIVNENDENAQSTLFELLKSFTSNLNTDDTDEVYSFLTNTKMAREFRGEYLVEAWNAVTKLPDKQINISRKTAVILHIADYVDIMPNEIISKIIINHIESVFQEWSTSDLDEAKWKLCAKYVATYKNDAELLNNVSLLKTVLSQAIKKWNDVHNETYVMQKFLVDFIDQVKSSRDKSDASFNPILKSILGSLNSLPLEEVYMLVWDLKVVILANNITGTSIDVKEFAIGIRDLVNEYIDKDIYFPSFLNEMADVIKNATLQLGSSNNDGRHKPLLVDLSDELITHNMTELALIAVRIMPKDQCSLKDELEGKYRSAISKLRASDSQEVRCLFYQTFVKPTFRELQDEVPKM